MNLKKFMLACIAGLTSFSVMAVGPLVLDSGTNQIVASWSQDLSLKGLGDLTGWSYKTSGATEFVALGSGADEASTVKSATKLDLNTSGGELKLAFGSAPLAIPTSGAYEYSVDTTFQFTKDWPTTLTNDLVASGAKTAVFAMAINADDDSQGARLVVAHGTSWNGAPAFASVQIPAPIATGVSYRVTIRVKGFGGNNAVENSLYLPATLFKVLVNGVEYSLKAFDGTTVGALVGFDGTEYLSTIGTGAGNWLASVSLNEGYYGTVPTGDVISSASFQGTGTLDNMALATYSDPIMASWTLNTVENGVVKDSGNVTVTGVIPAGTYTAVANSGYVLVSVATNGTPITVTAGAFTLAAATGLDTVTVTFRAAQWTLASFANGVVNDSTPAAVSAGVLPAGTYTVVPAAGYKLGSITGATSSNAGGFTLASPVADGTVTVTFAEKVVADTPASGDLATTTLLDDKTAWTTVTAGKTAAFDAWVSANSITFEKMNDTRAINAFLCNIAIDDVVADLLSVSEVSVAGTTLTAKVKVGKISVVDGALVVNGNSVAYVGTALGSLTAAGVGDVTIGAKVGDFVTITITMPAGTSGFVKFAIE